MHHFEKAATGCHPDTRHNLACIEEDNGNIERAVKHILLSLPRLAKSEQRNAAERA